MSDSPKHLYLVDGSAYIFRAYFGYPSMRRPDGTPVNALYGFCSMITKLLRETDADYIGIIFDKARRSFRNDIYPEYKAHRESAPDDLVPQFALIREACKAYNIPSLDMDNFEADDLIATYARMGAELGAKVSIISSDKDLMQLVNDNVTMYDPMKNITIDRDAVFEKLGVYPEGVIDLQALAGDSADNVPGVPGIGVKTAALLLNEFGNLESLLARAGEIKQPKRRDSLINFADQARISKELVTLRDNVEIEQALSFFKRPQDHSENLREFLMENDFKRLLAQLDNGHNPTNYADGSADSSAKGKRSDTPVVIDDSGFDSSGILPTNIDTDYVCIQDVDALKAWLAPVSEIGILAIDTETTGLHVMDCDIVGISLCHTYGKACYIPLRHSVFGATDAPGEMMGDLFGGGEVAPDVPAIKQISIADVVEILQPVLNDSSVLKVGQNIKYDLSILHKIGLSVSPIDDTMLLSFSCDAGLHGHGMNELAKLYLQHECIKFEDVCGKGKTKILFSEADLDKASEYACEDADITLRLHTILKAKSVANKVMSIYESIERPLVPVIAKMERHGIKINSISLQSLSREFGEEILKSESKVLTYAKEFMPDDFNLASPKQLGELLFEHLEFKGGKKTKTGAYSTNADALEKLKGTHPIIDSVLQYRTFSKLKSTYTDALQVQVSTATNRVHSSFNMVGAQTGRLSSTDPNLQNIPARRAEGQKIRKCFVADSGNKLVSLDYSQIELRIISHTADDPTMIEAFNKGADIHAATASSVFGMPLGEVNPDVRNRAKAINFGIIYGVSAHGLAGQIGCSRTEAKEFIDNYFAKFPKIKEYMEDTKSFVREHGYVDTLFGRKIHLAGAFSDVPMLKAHADRQAINAPIQGTSADIIKRAMIKVDEALVDTDMRMLLQVHDELIFEMPSDKAQSLIDLVKPIMENAHAPILDIKVPLLVDGNIGDNWGEAH